MWLSDEDMKAFRQNQKPENNIMPNISREYPPMEFEAEYIGGHPAISGKRKVKLMLEADKLLVCSGEFKSAFWGAPLLTIPLVNILNVANMPAQQLSALQFFGSGAPPGLMIPFKDSLKLSFRDELDMEQTCVFSMKKLEEAQREIYDRVIQEKKKRLGRTPT